MIDDRARNPAAARNAASEAGKNVERRTQNVERRRRRVLAAFLVLVAVILVLLARGLPPRAFYVGDPGVKLIAARNAIAHPSRPFDIDLPRAGGAPAPFLDPFFRVHGDHAHAITSGLFPLLTAPLLAALGIRGVYVLPALGFLLAIIGTAAAGIALGRTGAATQGRPYTTGTQARPYGTQRSPLLIAAVAALCTPLLFYALEFWEHALAVGVAAVATAVLFSSSTSRRTFAAGALFAFAILLRPEAAWYAIALLVAGPLFPNPIGARRAAAMATGTAAVLGLALGAMAALGADAGGHIVTNLSGAMHHWAADRLEILRAWIAPGPGVAIPMLMTVVLAVVASRVRSISPAAFIAIAAMVAIAAAARQFPVATILAAAPAAVALAGIRPNRTQPGTPALAVVIVVFSALVFMTAPNDGGGQWGPRYLLFASIPAAILLSDLIDGAWREARPAGAVAVVVLLVACAMVQRNAYKELQAGKRTYDRLVTAIETNVPAGATIVTDVWWLDQAAAAIADSRTFLVVDDAGAARRALGLVERGATGDTPRPQPIFVVRSDVESHGSLAEWLNGTGLTILGETPLDVRALTLSKLAPKPSGDRPLP